MCGRSTSHCATAMNAGTTTSVGTGIETAAARPAATDAKIHQRTIRADGFSREPGSAIAAGGPAGALTGFAGAATATAADAPTGTSARAAWLASRSTNV